MISHIVVGLIGLFAGWVFLPEPQWFRSLWARTGWIDRD